MLYFEENRSLQTYEYYDSRTNEYLLSSGLGTRTSLQGLFFYFFTQEIYYEPQVAIYQ